MQTLRNTLQFVRRHWIVAAVLVVVLSGGVALSASPGLRESVHQRWHRGLAWAGLAGEDADVGKTFWCPMHPQIRSNKPNSVCPICNMALVELTTTSKTLTLMPQQVQQTGLATEPVLRRTLYREIDTTGRITYDERNLKKITSWVRGKSRIEKLYVNFTGQRVRKGELLAELYSTDLLLAQDEYLNALKMVARAPGAEFEAGVLSAARKRLKDQGTTDAQIAALQKSRTPSDRVQVHAEIGGTVIKRHVQVQDWITEGKVLFEVADLSRLWVLADVFEEERPLIKVGMRVNLTVSTHPGKSFPGTVSFIDPVVKGETRTVPVRIDVDNRDGTLSPGMFAGIQLRHRFAPLLAVPENAVLWSGKRTVVIVRNGEGTFEPREVQLGRMWLYLARDSTSGSGKSLATEFGGGQQRFHEVLFGLFPGEEVVTSGAFLLNAESQFRQVLLKMLPPESERVSLAEAVGRPIAERMEAVLDAYFKLSETLADDRIKDVDRRVEALKQTAAALTKTAGEADVKKLKTDAGDFQKLMAENTAHPVKDAKDARTRFGEISHVLTKLLAENGGKTLFGKSLYQFECGMAKVGYERWLWRTPQIHNPYMGRKMLTCGKKLDVLKP